MFSQCAAVVCQPGGKGFAGGVEHYLGAADGGRTEEEQASTEALSLAAAGVYYLHRADLAAVFVVHQALYYRIGFQGQVSGCPGSGQGGALRAEITACRASPVAGPAVMAGAASVVVLRENGCPTYGHAQVWRLPGQSLLDSALQRKIGHGRQKFAVG